MDCTHTHTHYLSLSLSLSLCRHVSFRLLFIFSYDGGDPHSSGCYCSHCMSGFTTALNSGAMNASARSTFNVTSQFDYKEYLLSNPPGGAAAPKSKVLRSLFVDFQQNSTRAYVSHTSCSRTIVCAALLACSTYFSCANCCTDTGFISSTEFTCSSALRWHAPFHMYCEYAKHVHSRHSPLLNIITRLQVLSMAAWSSRIGCPRRASTRVQQRWGLDRHRHSLVRFRDGRALQALGESRWSRNHLQGRSATRAQAGVQYTQREG